MKKLMVTGLFLLGLSLWHHPMLWGELFNHWFPIDLKPDTWEDIGFLVAGGAVAHWFKGVMASIDSAIYRVEARLVQHVDGADGRHLYISDRACVQQHEIEFHPSKK